MAASHAVRSDIADRRVPPVTALGMLSIALVAGGVIWLASYLPKHAPLGPAVAFLATAAAVLAANLLLLLRTRAFPWWRFLRVAAWALLAYVVIAGMLEYVFVYDHTRGGVLAVMTAMLVVFTLNVPLLIGFTVARFETAHNGLPAGARR
jgi:membrane-bound acyltransferase YfiQ involved in biofilm formation